MAHAATVYDEVTEADFAQVVLDNSDRVPVLVDFWAPWCQPCQMLAPILSKLADAYQGSFILAKVNTDQQQRLAMEYGIRSLPTVKVFRNRSPVDEFMGVQPEGNIRALIDRYAARASDAVREEAARLLDSGRGAEALQRLEDAAQADPDNERVIIDLVSMLEADGRLDEAETRLRQLPINVQESEDISRLKARLALRKQVGESASAEDLERRLQRDPSDSEARFFLGVKQLFGAHPEQGLEHLVQLVERDRRYGDDAARKALLAAFEILNDKALTDAYRQRMSRALY